MADTDYNSLWQTAWHHAASDGPGFQSRHACLLRLLGRFSVTGRLLEVGAGQGQLLERIHQRFPELQLTALEPSETAAEVLRTRAGVSAVHHGELDNPSSQPAGPFDAVICSEVLEHIEDDSAAMKTLVDLCGPGSLLFLTVPLRPELWTRVDDAVGHVRRYEPGQLKALCQAHGLTVLHDEAHGFPLYNTYYRLLGRKSPQQTADAARKSAVVRAAAKVVAAAFLLETRVHTSRGARGFLVARKP